MESTTNTDTGGDSLANPSKRHSYASVDSGFESGGSGCDIESNSAKPSEESTEEPAIDAASSVTAAQSDDASSDDDAGAAIVVSVTEFNQEQPAVDRVSTPTVADTVTVLPVMPTPGLQNSRHGWSQQQHRQQQGGYRYPPTNRRAPADPRNGPNNGGYIVDRLRADISRLQVALQQAQAEKLALRAAIEAEVEQHTFLAAQDLIHQVFKKRMDISKVRHQMHTQHIELQRREMLTKQLEEYLAAGQKALAPRLAELIAETDKEGAPAPTVSWSQAQLAALRGEIIAQVKAEYEHANARIYAKYTELDIKKSELEMLAQNWKISAKESVRKEALAEYEAGIGDRLQKAYEQGLVHGREVRHKSEVEDARERGYQEAKREMEALRRYERKLAGKRVEEGDGGEVKETDKGQKSLIEVEDLLG